MDWLDAQTVERLVSVVGLPALMLLVMVRLVARGVRELFDTVIRPMTSIAQNHVKALDTSVERIETAVIDTSHAIQHQAETITRVVEQIEAGLDEKGDKRYRDHTFSTYRTNKALIRHADAIEALAGHLPSDAAASVKPHADAIREILKESDKCPS